MTGCLLIKKLPNLNDKQQKTKNRTPINQLLQVYNDSLVQWKNAPKKQRDKIKTRKVVPAHEKLSTAYKSEVRSMAHSSAALRSPKRGMRVLRSRKHSIDLVNTAGAQRLKRFLKIARVSAFGAIVIDTALAGQKVQSARDARENAEKVAYEEYEYFPIHK